MKALIMIFLFFPIIAFAMPQPESVRKKSTNILGPYPFEGIPFINGKPKNIYNHTYEYLNNGLILEKRKLYEDEYILFYYNEYNNANVNLQSKLNETIFIANISFDATFKEYNITTKDNIISVIYTNENKNIWKNTCTVTLTFDQMSKRLKYYEHKVEEYSYRYDRVFERTIAYYEYEYDVNDRLIRVHSIYNNEKKIIKQYYYDGQVRLLEKPYYCDVESPALEEIVIYDDSLLKYYIRLYDYPIGDHMPPDTVEERNRRKYHILFEFDENGNEIMQIKYYGNNRSRGENDEIVTYGIQNLKLDEYLNWTENVITNYNNNEVYKQMRVIEY